MTLPVLDDRMDVDQTKRILLALWKITSRIGFTAFLLGLAFVAQSNDFTLAAAVFLLFSIGGGIITIRSFTAELGRLRYITQA